MTPQAISETPHVLVLGGGFGGLSAVRELAGARARVTLVDRRNHHLFQPLLYQVATASLAAPSIAAPLRQILRKQDQLIVLLDWASAYFTNRRHARIVSGDEPGSDDCQGGQARGRSRQ